MGLPLEKLPDWPAAMSREEALAYTRVAGTQMDDWARRGLVRFTPKGPRGQMIAAKVDLDAALQSLFAAEVAADGPIEF